MWRWFMNGSMREWVHSMRLMTAQVDQSHKSGFSLIPPNNDRIDLVELQNFPILLIAWSWSYKGGAMNDL